MNNNSLERLLAIDRAADDARENGDDLFPLLIAHAVITEFDLHLEYEDYATDGRSRITSLSYRIARLCFSDDETRFTLYDYLEAAVNNTDPEAHPAELLDLPDSEFVDKIRSLAEHKRELYA